MPASFRWVTLAAVILGFQVAFVSVLEIEDARHPEQIANPDSGSTTDAEAFKALSAGHRGALVQLKPWRVVTLVGLAGAGGIIYFLGMRLRMRARNAQRTAIWLSRAMVGAAVLRMLDGAQLLVIARDSADNVARVALEQPELGAKMMFTPLYYRLALMGGTALMSGLMVTAFVALSSYFRSERLRASLERLESVP